jgi:hypothetical protein
VWTSGDKPLAGATVTLYAFDVEAGAFRPVPDGDARMSPLNRANPDTTDASGGFGWDLSAGIYKIRARKAGCSAPYLPAQAYIETDVLVGPAASAADLDLFFDCRVDKIKIHLPVVER